jgi:prepilin-type N-terminal cleavage/methylation domain-containing protein
MFRRILPSQAGLVSPKHRLDPRGEGGFTLTEMLIASAIMLTITGAVFSVMNPAQGTFEAQPEVSDMQQRLRVAVESLRGDLVMAGAGSYMGASAGSLYNFFAPVMPYRTGFIDDDMVKGVYYRNDAISLLYVPPTPAQTHVVKTLGNNSQEIDVTADYNCGASKKDALCAFKEGMRVLIMDPSGKWDTTTITQVQDAALHLQHAGKLNNTYGSTAIITQVMTATYWLKADTKTNTYQLMKYDGYKTDLPIVDNVVKLEFEYFGDPQPPQLLPPGPNTCLTNCSGPWTTYGPKPPDIASDFDPNDDLGAGENCVFKVENGQQLPRLAVLDAGVAQVKLDPAILKDGNAWCPNSTAGIKFDADLLRIRRVRVKLRVQVGLDQLRGPAGLLFKYGGTSTSAQRYVPDQEVSFDITPRNMNLGR